MQVVSKNELSKNLLFVKRQPMMKAMIFAAGKGTRLQPLPIKFQSFGEMSG